MVNITELPLEKQKEILEKVDAIKKKSKYGNTKTKVGNVTFDSKKEAQRFEELIRMEESHIIRGLKLQPEFTLIEGYRTPDGEKIKPTRYIADFLYVDCSSGNTVIEDVKSQATKTPQYKLKKKLLKEKYGYDVVEV